MTPAGEAVDEVAESVAHALAAAYDAERSRIVATLIRITRDWDLAEDCAQDAVERALATWPTDGVPRSPGAWLTTVARNRAIDRLRRGARETAVWEEAVIDELEAWHASYDGPDLEDDRLRLVFTCCHPALPLEARVALTLRTVAGLTTAEIASAFLVPEATMAQRLVRAKKKIKHAGIPYRVPPAHLLGERVPGVLAVLYLLYNEGYAASAGESLQRTVLADEAIRVARVLADLMPDEPEVLGLLALLLLQHARRDARTDAAGDVVLLEDQDRGRWHADEIAEGLARLRRGSRIAAAPGSYLVQASIAACHATAASADATDLARIADLYTELLTINPSPVIALNRAIARGLAHGPEVGLTDLADLAAEGRLDGYFLLPAAQADLFRRLGRTAEALERYAVARDLAPTEPQRRYLSGRITELTAPDSG